MEKKDIKVLYEDNELMVVDKPAGWVTTREINQLSIIPQGDFQKGANYQLSPKGTSEGAKNKNIYLEDWVGEYLGKYQNSNVKSQKKEKLPRNGIVHRLDKGTSGMVVIAKTESSLRELKKQFKQRLVRKRYFAVACGDLPKVGGVNMPIDRSKYSFGKFKVSEEGKSAVTEFDVIKKFKINGRTYSLVDINLKTGRTHQIRVHFNYLGWPLLGDKIYGGQVTEGLLRPFLHAYQLEIDHPVSQKRLQFKSELADDLKKVLENYG